jgi:hypothetical protein
MEQRTADPHDPHLCHARLRGRACPGAARARPRHPAVHAPRPLVSLPRLGRTDQLVTEPAEKRRFLPRAPPDLPTPAVRSGRVNAASIPARPSSRRPPGARTIRDDGRTGARVPRRAPRLFPGSAHACSDRSRPACSVRRLQLLGPGARCGLVPVPADRSAREQHSRAKRALNLIRSERCDQVRLLAATGFGAPSHARRRAS